MKKINIIWSLVLGLCSLAFMSCSSDDDNQSTMMTIDAIYLEDASSGTSVHDRLISVPEIGFVRLGQTIRIQGSGFTGLKKILINGYDTYFNNALLTDNNVWVSLNTKTPVGSEAGESQNTIVLVKDKSTASYAFTVRAASPSITSISCTMPMPGETVKVSGANLHETSKVTLPGGVVVTDIDNDPDGEWFSFIMPEGVTEAGYIESEGVNGKAQSPSYFNDFRCFIINYDEDGHGVLGSWSATYSADDLVDDPLLSGRGKCVMIIPQSVLDEGGVAAGKTSLPGFYTAGNDEATDDWTRMTEFISGETSINNVALQFDVYVPGEWDLTGQVQFTLQNNLSTYGYGAADAQYSNQYIHQAYVWVPWLDDSDFSHTVFTTDNQWQTVTIPLNKFGNYTSEADYPGDWGRPYTFSSVITDRNSGSYRNLGVLFSNADIKNGEDVAYPGLETSQKIYIDNLRIVNTTANSVSDFDD